MLQTRADQSPGIRLSRKQPSNPPMNMWVLSSIDSIWSARSLPASQYVISVSCRH